MLRALPVLVFAMLSVSATPPATTFTGTISDDVCATGGGHSKMQMGPTDAECTKACILLHGAQYVLVDGKNVYVLSDQKKPEAFAAKRVTVTGTLDAKTKVLTVASIAEVKAR